MMAIILLTGLFGVLSPRLFKPYGNKLSYASLFSSGILLSAAVVHLLGDASEGLSESPLPDFPWAYFLCGLSFYALYFFERWVIHLLVHNHKHDHDDTNNLDDVLLEIDVTPKPSTEQEEEIKSIFSDPIFDDHGQDLVKLMKHKNSLSGFVLLIGLGLHSFLAGLGLGSSVDNTQAFALAVAIISHKYLAAFTLGCPFYKSQIPLIRHITVAVAFSVITPFGILIGWLLADGFESWVSDLFISIASGTFVYVAIIEILVPEFSELKKKERLIWKAEQSIQSMHLEERNIGKNTLNEIQQKVKNDVMKREKKKIKTTEFIKGISVVSGFVIMSLLALWV